MAIKKNIKGREDEWYNDRLRNMDVKHFKLSEFDCPTDVGSGENMCLSFLSKLDDARELAGVPFKINSGYRCEKHPLSKKNPTSSHIKGIAADIRFIDSKNLALIMGGLGGAGFERFGIDFKNKFIHTDCDQDKTNPCIWGY